MLVTRNTSTVSLWLMSFIIIVWTVSQPSFSTPFLLDIILKHSLNYLKMSHWEVASMALTLKFGQDCNYLDWETMLCYFQSWSHEKYVLLPSFLLEHLFLEPQVTVQNWQARVESHKFPSWHPKVHNSFASPLQITGLWGKPCWKVFSSPQCFSIQSLTNLQL
jgi:hypothetical protein